MSTAHTFAPTPPFRRSLYSRLRDLGTRRARAADVAGVSYRTAQRLDEAEHRCGQCGRAHPDHEDR